MGPPITRLQIVLVGIYGIGSFGQAPTPPTPTNAPVSPPQQPTATPTVAPSTSSGSGSGTGSFSGSGSGSGTGSGSGLQVSTTTSAPSTAPTGAPTVAPTTGSGSGSGSGSSSGEPTSASGSGSGSTTWAPSAVPTATPTIDSGSGSSTGSGSGTGSGSSSGSGSGSGFVSTAVPTATPTTSPSTSTTAAPTATPTATPTLHPCADGSHACVTPSTYCSDDTTAGGGPVIGQGDLAYVCVCNTSGGFVNRTSNTTCDTLAPTATPTATPSFAPSAFPTVAPTTQSPTALPTAHPTIAPTAAPTARPTPTPSFSPTFLPTAIPTGALVSIEVTFTGDLTLLTPTAQTLFESEALTALVGRMNGVSESDALSTSLTSGSIVFDTVFPQTVLSEATAEATAADINTSPLSVSLNGATFTSTGAISSPLTWAPTHTPTSGSSSMAPTGSVAPSSSKSDGSSGIVIAMSIILVVLAIALIALAVWKVKKNRDDENSARLQRHDMPSSHFNTAFQNPLIVNSPSPSGGRYRDGRLSTESGNELMDGYRAPQSPGGESASSWLDMDKNYIEMDSNGGFMYTTTIVTDETAI